MERGHALELGRRTHAVAREGRVAAWLRRPWRRREADALLRVSGGRWENHPSVAWRVAELTSPRERRVFAGSLRSIVREVHDTRVRLSASVIARRELRPHAAELEKLADRLADLGRPATGAAMVLVHDLLTDGGGPLYGRGNSIDELPAALGRIRTTLEAT